MTTLDVEITSATTARVTAPDTEVVQLSAADRTALWTAIHQHSTQHAHATAAPVDVTVREADKTKFVTVTPDGTATASTPSGPIPTPNTPPAQPGPSTDATAPEDSLPAGPVLMAADPLPPAATPRLGRPVAPPSAGPRGAVSTLAAPSVPAAAREPARLGLRGRVNALLGATLTPRPSSREARLRQAAAALTGPLPDRATVAVVNVKGGVGKTPLALALAATVATHRGAGSVVAVDLGEAGSSFADRIATPPTHEQNALSLLTQLDAAADVYSGTLTRYLARQPSGEDALAAGADTDRASGYDDVDRLAALLGRYRELLVVDTGNSHLADRWRWAIAAAHAVIVPVPLRHDAAAAAQRTLHTMATVRSDVLTRSVVVITDGPGDAPVVETAAVDAFTALGVPVCRMPFEPRFAAGDRITLRGLRRPTRDALAVLAATAVELMAPGTS
ncbi:chromosome partitioning protein [Rhodococcus sp. DMU1]|uniref:chromosome partitioning protein n=1 Tax=Rhodococcus sp. DMU1 TaxID=2722825 RepID=UPI00143E60BC|nr:chromosome partitioning protein [Rhodococcus sp. DMU1]QIX53904.1 chromosome partitioning protein [Rhodococcus sp. DMU1]